ncbi:MAG: hypothetical protein ACPGED_00995 [Flavobacteriales bacterium]
MKKFFLPFLVLMVVLSACKKDEEDKDNDAAAAIDHSIANSFFNDLYKVIDEAADQTDGIRALECVDSFTIDTAATPKSILIDFGQDACTDQLGVDRRGQVLATFTGRYREQGTIITITPIDYTVDGWGLSGTKTIVNEGLNAQDQPYFTVEVDNATITHPNNDFSSTWSSNTVRTWTEGVDTFFLVDDEYSVTGNASGTDRNGLPYSITIQQALEFDVVCPWIKKGVVKVTPEGKIDRIVNYGNGNCDNDATLSIGDININISL